MSGKQVCVAAILSALLLAACQPPYDEEAVVAEIHTRQTAVAAAATPTAISPPATPLPQPTETPAPTGQAPPLPTERGDLFAASGMCAACHTNLVDEAGNDVSNDALWRSTMMANSARDPYWQASVRKETLDNPALAAVIEDKCATCHTPMARTTAAIAGGTGAVLDTGFLNPDHPLHTLAMDGISCTLCHQIEAEHFGALESFSGHYVINPALPAGERLIYGPFVVDPAFAAVMQGASGYVPAEGTHIQQSEMCATCHTLYTPSVNAAGEVVSELPEQMPYLEWLASDYAATQSCQDCHMPPAVGGVVLSITGGPVRSPVRQHTFVGGNNYALTVFRQMGEQLGATAGRQHFEATIARMQEQLQTQTATLAVENAALDGETLTFEVAITNLVGHKFPSGFPSRRVWLHITVTDANGATIFESGAVDAQGRISGNDNDADPAAFEPHYEAISSPEQVQIYEAIMLTAEGEVTTTLLRGARYGKDNRLLPAGFDKAAASPDIAVYGAAADDADFVGGGDRLRVSVDVGSAAGPFMVTVELLYQSIAYRWAENLRAYEAPEPAAFMAIYDEVPNLPATVATAQVEVGP